MKEAHTVEPWEYVSLASKQLSKWQRLQAQLLEALADASGFVRLEARSTAVVTEGHAVLFHRPVFLSLLLSLPPCL